MRSVLSFAMCVCSNVCSDSVHLNVVLTKDVLYQGTFGDNEIR